MGFTLPHTFCTHCGKKLKDKKGDAIYCADCLRKTRRTSANEINKKVNKVKKKTRLLKGVAEQDDLMDEVAEKIAEKADNSECNALFPNRLGRMMSNSDKKYLIK